MKKLLKNHIYKLIYIFLFLLTLFSVIDYECDITHDRKNIKENVSHTEVIKVCSIPKYSNDVVYFTARTAIKSNLKAMLSVRIDYAQNLKLNIGDTIKLRGKYELPDKALNPGGYDYGNYLKSLGVSVVLNSNIHEVIYHKKSFFTPIYNLREKISSKIDNSIHPFASGIVKALVTGDKDSMDENLKESFKRAGVYHVVAVSGLHLSLLVMFLSFFYVNLRIKRKIKSIVSFAVTVLGCVFMLIFTGFGISVERAAFMAMLVCLSTLVSREYSPFVSLYLVCVFVLITEPYSWRDMSFCLSFSATAGVLAGAEIVNKYNIMQTKHSSLWQSLIISQCANLTTIPFTVYTFNGMSLISALSNLVILIIVPLLLGLSYIFALVCAWSPGFVVEFTAGMVSAVASAVNHLVLWFAALPYSYVSVSNHTELLLAAGACGIAAFCKLKSKLLKILTALLILVANICFLAYNIPTDKVTVTFLNSGQGECSIIKDSRGAVTMIDCGSETRTSFAENEVIPYLAKQGIFKIDALFITHYHADHANGALALLESGYVNKLILPDRTPQPDEESLAKEIYRAAVKNKVSIYHVGKGDIIYCGKKHRFEILSPHPHSKSSANNLSLVIKYTFQGKNILYTGDIEDEIIYTLNKTLDEYDVIKVPHHGAKAMQNKKTAKITNADYAVISCGENNKYNHPHESTLDAFSNSEILRTDLSGDPVSFEIYKNKIKKKEK